MGGDRGVNSPRMLLEAKTNRAWLAAAFIGLLVDCKAKGTDPDEARGPVPAASTPVDHLLPGQLIEGKEKAFALGLPRELKVERRFETAVHASGPLSPEDVANFFRARVRDGKITVGATSTKFDKVRVPAEPDRELSIRVESGAGERRCRVVVEDITPPKLPDLPDEAARLKAAGFSPTGKLLDPEHLK